MSDKPLRQMISVEIPAHPIDLTDLLAALPADLLAEMRARAARRLEKSQSELTLLEWQDSVLDQALALRQGDGAA